MNETKPLDVILEDYFLTIQAPLFFKIDLTGTTPESIFLSFN